AIHASAQRTRALSAVGGSALAAHARAAASRASGGMPACWRRWRLRGSSRLKGKAAYALREREGIGCGRSSSVQRGAGRRHRSRSRFPEEFPGGCRAPCDALGGSERSATALPEGALKGSIRLPYTPLVHTYTPP